MTRVDSLAADSVPTPLVPPRPDSIPLRAWATVGEGVFLAIIVGRSGTPWWQAARVVIVLVLFAGAFQLQRSDRRWVIGLVSVVVGVVGIVTGAAIGLMNVIKSGQPLPAAAGLVCLISGLYLLVVGAIALIRLLHGWWRLLAVPVIYVVLQFLLLPLIAPDYWVSNFFGNTMYLLALCYYLVITFLGYNGEFQTITCGLL